MELIALYIVAATLGAMVFFAAGIAPTVFQALPADEAGRLSSAAVPALLPRLNPWVRARRPAMGDLSTDCVRSVSAHCILDLMGQTATRAPH